MSQKHWRVVDHIRRAKQANLPHTLTDEEWFATLKYFNGKCAYCQQQDVEVLEHFIPIPQGGGTSKGNCVPACTSCNTCKEHPKSILLGDREQAHAALLRVAGYLCSTGDKDFQQSVVDGYINAQYLKVPFHQKPQPVEHIMEENKQVTNIVTTSPFDVIRQIEHGQEFWSARALQGLLGYTEWRKFEDAIERATIACQNSGQAPLDHFVPSAKMISLAKSAEREVKDYHLSRYACYLTAMNGDPRKPEISTAQTYFAVKTREAETTEGGVHYTTPLQGAERFIRDVLPALDQEHLQALKRIIVAAEQYERAVQAFLDPQKPYIQSTPQRIAAPKEDRDTVEEYQVLVLKHLKRHGPLTFNTLYHSYMKRRDEMTTRKALDVLVEQGAVQKETTSHSIKYSVDVVSSQQA